MAKNASVPPLVRQHDVAEMPIEFLWETRMGLAALLQWPVNHRRLMPSARRVVEELQKAVLLPALLAQDPAFVRIVYPETIP